MSTRTALLEREDELATIRRSLERAKAGEGSLLTIEGEAGAGKTALLEAAGELAQRHGATVLRARGGEFERDFPYGVVRQLFEPVLQQRGRDELLVGTAAMARPIFEPSGSEQGADAFTLQHGLYWLLADLAAGAPLLLLVDDAQWADLESLKALLYTARRLEDQPVALALTVRTGEDGTNSGALAELRTPPLAKPIRLRALSGNGTAAMITGASGRSPTPHFADACHEVTAGNPLLMVELLRSLDSSGSDGAFEDPAELAELAARGVSGSILARLEKLGPTPTSVAGAVAILEPNAEMHVVASLTELSRDEVAGAAERLITAQLLFDSRPLAFVHPLVRAAVLNQIPEPVRAVAHARAARLLDDDGAETDSVAAHLLLAAQADDRWVVEKLRSAAEAAVGRGVPGTAVSYLRRAMREPPVKEERPLVSQELGEALLMASDPEGIEVLSTVRASTDDSKRRAELAVVMANSLSIRGGNEEAAALLEESLAEVGEPAGPLGLHLRSFLLLQVVWGLERLPDLALPRHDEAIPADSFEARMLLQAAALLYAFGLGPLETAERLVERVLAADRVTEDAQAGSPPFSPALVLTLAGRGDLGQALLERAIATVRQRGVAVGVHGGYGLRGLCHFLDGDLRSAQADAEIAVPFLHGIGVQAPTAVYLGAAIRTQVAHGDFARAGALLDQYWEGRKPLPGGAGAMLLCARAELRQAKGRHAEARHDYLAAGERVSWMQWPNLELFPWRTGLAACEAALGNVEEAQRLASDALALARTAGGMRGVGIGLRAQGAACQGDEAVELLRESVGALKGTRARLQYAMALVDLGSALRRANHRKDAREPLREGLELARSCGSGPLAERARQELEATGARPRSEVRSGLDALTPSELRVARMAAEGLTNREIAQQLFVTVKTIETHLRHTYQKLDITGREDLRLDPR